MSRFKEYLQPVIWTLLALAGFITLLVFNETSREVTLVTLHALFGLFTTPFIFEATCLFLSVVFLLTFNQWRLQKEGDGWVYLLTQEPEPGTVPAAITQRLQSVVLTEKPEWLDESQTDAGVIEGYLELGMATQAATELKERTELADNAETSALRLRVLAANLDTAAAQSQLQSTRERFPESTALLATAALDNARWLLKHLHQADTARLWMGEAKSLLPAILEELAIDDPLRSIQV
jgi:hypothetical protein